MYDRAPDLVDRGGDLRLKIGTKGPQSGIQDECGKKGATYPHDSRDNVEDAHYYEFSVHVIFLNPVNRRLASGFAIKRHCIGRITYAGWA